MEESLQVHTCYYPNESFGRKDRTLQMVPGDSLWRLNISTQNTVRRIIKWLIGFRNNFLFYVHVISNVQQQQKVIRYRDHKMLKNVCNLKIISVKRQFSAHSKFSGLRNGNQNFSSSRNGIRSFLRFKVWNPEFVWFEERNPKFFRFP